MDHDPAGTSKGRIDGFPRRSSLYISGLQPGTDELALFEKFTDAGPVDSIRIVREMITFRPLGSAYVNFQRPQDAERAFQTMDGDLVQDYPIRITWPEVDTVTPHLLAGILVKNLDDTMDNQSVCDMFSSVGNVLSCKVALDMQGSSKGYAFVYFYAMSSVEVAIAKVNGLVVNGFKLAVSHLFTNLHVKNFGDRLTQESLREFFAPFGSIKAYGVPTKDGKSCGCGFVAYDSPEAAGHAMEAMNGKELSNGKQLRVVPAPQRELNTVPVVGNSEAVQVFVRNLDASVDNGRLMEMFAPYGELREGFIVKERGKSKGFGFVTYASSDQAARAIVEMNDREVAGKRVFVAMARRKDLKQVLPVSTNSDNEPSLDDSLLLTTITNPDELKSLLARRLYPLVKECVNTPLAGRVTFQLVNNHSPSELAVLLKDSKRLQSVAREINANCSGPINNLRLQLQLLSALANSAAA